MSVWASLELGPGTCGLQGLSVSGAERILSSHIQMNGSWGRVLRSSLQEMNPTNVKSKTRAAPRPAPDEWMCKKWAGPAEAPRIPPPPVPRERGDKIISRDPKWAVLWRCWKKPFSGAAANSVQVQITDLDPGGEERGTFMSDQVGTTRRWSLFIRPHQRRCSPRRTQSARCHILSLSCSPPDSLSVDLRWLLCVPLWFFCASAAPRCCRFSLGWLFSRCSCCSVSGGGAPETWKRFFVAPQVEERSWCTRWGPHRGDSVICCCVPPRRLHVAARLLLSARCLTHTTCR